MSFSFTKREKSTFFWVMKSLPLKLSKELIDWLIEEEFTSLLLFRAIDTSDLDLAKYLLVDHRIAYYIDDVDLAVCIGQTEMINLLKENRSQLHWFHAPASTRGYGW